MARPQVPSKGRGRRSTGRGVNPRSASAAAIASAASCSPRAMIPPLPLAAVALGRRWRCVYRGRPRSDPATAVCGESVIHALCPARSRSTIFIVTLPPGQRPRIAALIRSMGT